jgi:hypothetical protein
MNALSSEMVKIEKKNLPPAAMFGSLAERLLRVIPPLFDNICILKTDRSIGLKFLSQIEYP